MTIYGAKDLAGAFRTVRGNTLIIANELTDEQYTFSPAEGTRTAGQLLTHIAIISTLAEQVHFIEHRTTLEGFDFPAFMGRAMAEEKKLRTKEEIIALLTENGDRFAASLDGASDAFLAEVVSMPPGMTPAGKTRFEMLLGVKEHEMHHRGQLMLIQRILGGVPHLTRQMMERFAAQTAAAAAR
jgi:uncharacterized damage-inducible protein DinB